VKPFICRYGPVKSVKGEGLTGGKGVKTTHSDPGWLVLSVSGPRKQSFNLLWSPIPVFNADFSTTAGQHCLTWGGHSIYAVVTTLTGLLTLDTKEGVESLCIFPYIIGSMTKCVSCQMVNK